jgi:broad specificity phosphatase PhoE
MHLTIKLVRHGQSLANVSALNSWEVGDHAIELTPDGHRQAEVAGAGVGETYLRDALIYSSSFRRARQTLDGVLRGAGLDRAGLRIYEDPRLREVEHGYSDVPQQRALQETHGQFYYRFHGGESPADCYDRTSGFLEGLMRQVRRKSAERVLIVTHGLTIRCFVMRFLHLTVEQFDSMHNPANCDVITLAPIDQSRDPNFATSRWAASGLGLRRSLSS